MKGSSSLTSNKYKLDSQRIQLKRRSGRLSNIRRKQEATLRLNIRRKKENRKKS